MASSSQPLKKYEVFISFRGEDNRYTFTNHLHDALRRNHIDTYIDYRIEKGDEVWPALEKAIEDSTLFIVIFSENYASSTWCLNELTKILECSKNQRHRVMPVFYRVDPSHVRKQSASYKEAFDQHERKGIKEEQLQKWRESLSDAANRSGWPCSLDRDEVKIIGKIVKRVIRKLGHRNPSEDYLEGLIGIRRRMTKLESLLDKGSNDDVRFIGIWGMGGLGKTTLARALFQKLHLRYEGSCFLENIREESKRCGNVALKQKLMSELLQGKKSDSGRFDFVIKRQTNFLVLDDVNDQDQLEDLAKSRWFGPGSKILITSRDKQILENIVGDGDMCMIEALNFEEALKLLSLKAFKTNCDDPEVRELAKNGIGYASGNPLALKVLGSLMNGKNPEEWKSQLGKLQKLPHKKINNILKLSFEGLEDDEEKNIFLHIACFFNQYNVKNIKNWLDACGYSTIIGLRRLEEKALLDTHSGRICVHHLIQEMGRQIVRENSYPEMRIRIWNCKKIYKILKDNEGNTAIEGVILEASDEIEEKCSSLLAFRLPNIRFLVFHKDSNENKIKFPGGIEVLPNKLILLCSKGYPLKSLPATFKGESLVQIQLCESKLTKLWDGVQNLVNLRKIDLVRLRDLIELPNFSKAIHLERVKIEGCSKLRSVDPSILSLDSLQDLALIGCKALTSLTSNTHLKSLCRLMLTGCSRLNKFSLTSKHWSFRVIILGIAINELCSSSGQLSEIESLNLSRCKNVTSLHKLFNTRNLRFLRADECNKLASNLRSIFDEMRALDSLCLHDCSELFEVPDNISLLSSLRELGLSRANIETLPLSIKQLWRLNYLGLEGCERLQSLLEIPSSISTRSGDNCQSLGTSHLSHLDHYDKPYSTFFRLADCIKLDEQSIKAVEAKVLFDINNAHCFWAGMEYPGERVPEWFMYRTTRSLVTVDLHSIPQPWDGIFIFCLVISKQPAPFSYVREIDVKWFVDGQDASTPQRSFCSPFSLSNHVILWCNKDAFREIDKKIEKKKRDYESNTSYPLLQLQFTVSCYIETAVGEIKECGVCPTSAPGYQNYIKQIQMASHPHPNSYAMQAPSRKRKYHSLLR